jgi:transcriptional regulator with XRE-family HTH domain
MARMSTFGARLRRMRKAAGLSQEALAHACGRSGQSWVSNLERDDRTPDIADAKALAAALSVSVGELMGDSAAPVPDAGWDDVLGYAQAVGLGSGPDAQEYAETHRLKFRSDSLARKRLRAHTLAVMYGVGDSMMPRIHPGDAILFDTSDTRPHHKGLFVLLLHGIAGNAYCVKRCLIFADGVVYFDALNPDGDHDWQVPRRMDDPDSPLMIIGRVKWLGSWVE